MLSLGFKAISSLLTNNQTQALALALAFALFHLTKDRIL